jgi:hypothetical protein
MAEVMDLVVMNESIMVLQIFCMKTKSEIWHFKVQTEKYPTIGLQHIL